MLHAHHHDPVAHLLLGRHEAAAGLGACGRQGRQGRRWAAAAAVGAGAGGLCGARNSALCSAPWCAWRRLGGPRAAPKCRRPPSRGWRPHHALSRPGTTLLMHGARQPPLHGAGGLPCLLASGLGGLGVGARRRAAGRGLLALTTPDRGQARRALRPCCVCARPGCASLTRAFAGCRPSVGPHAPATMGLGRPHQGPQQWRALLHKTAFAALALHFCFSVLSRSRGVADSGIEFEGRDEEGYGGGSFAPFGPAVSATGGRPHESTRRPLDPHEMCGWETALEVGALQSAGWGPHEPCRCCVTVSPAGSPAGMPALPLPAAALCRRTPDHQPLMSPLPPLRSPPHMMQQLTRAGGPRSGSSWWRRAGR